MSHCQIVKCLGVTSLYCGELVVGVLYLTVMVCLFAYRPSNMLVYLRDGSARTILHAATLR